MLLRCIVRRVLSPVAVLALCACYTWQAQPAPASSVITERQPDHVRLTLADGRTIELDAPVISGDSISGLLPGSAQPGFPLQRASLATVDIVRIDRRQRDASRIFAMGIGVPLLVVLGALLVGVK